MSKNIKILDIQGSSVGELALEDKFIETEKGVQAVHDVVIAYLAENRTGSASTKTRSEVRGGGAKPWRQKGTGRARAGSIRSPIWKGGGVAFGPQPRSYAKKINKKVRTLALRRAFTERLNEDAVILIDSIQIPDHKTKNIIAILNSLKVCTKALMIVKDYDENVLRATANLPDLLLIKADTVNVYQLLQFDKIIITKDALEQLKSRLV